MEITAEMLSVLDQSAGPTGLIEFLEISHPNWPSVLRYVVNSSEPITVKHEDGQSFEYIYSPIQITRSSDQDTLDQEVNFMIGDVGQIVPDLIDLFIHDEEIEAPFASYRAYFVGQYDAPIFIAKNLEIESITRDWQGTQGDAKAPGLNDSGNGGIYSASTDPSLIGFY